MPDIMFIFENIRSINEENLEVLINLTKFMELLDATEFTLNEKITLLNEETNEMFDSLESNTNLLKIICENTSQ